MYLRKRGNKWCAEVYVMGQREAKSFQTRMQARAWAQEREEALQKPQNSLGDALTRYAREVSPSKKGARWEALRLANLAATMDCRKLPIADIKPAHIAAWKDGRLGEVSGSTVRREMNLLASVFETARREWGWTAANPCRDVRKPANPPARKRGISQDEIDRICLALCYEDHLPVTLKSQEVAIAFLLGIETAMRAGEILRAHKGWAGRVVTLRDTKTGADRRVPLSSRAVELLGKIPNGFTVNSSSLDTLFRRARDKAGARDVHFHDSRSEALTRLSKKLTVLELAAMVGHSDPRSLMWYYSQDAEETADKLG